MALYEDAEFYDLEFQARDHELPFFLNWARRSGSPVLEVACGTGRLTLPMAEDGLDVTGVDVAPAMIARARQKQEGTGVKVDWQVQDCRQLTLPRRYRFVFSATNAMQHLHDHESVNSFLRGVKTHLESDGVFALDVFQPNLRKLLRGPEEKYLHKTIQGFDGKQIDVSASSRYEASSQILSFSLEYRSADRLILTKEVNMRCFFPEELIGLCRSSGLEVTHRFGDYDESDFTSASPKQILICKRAD